MPAMDEADAARAQGQAIRSTWPQPGSYDKIVVEWSGNQIVSLIRETAREASICRVRLLDPGVIEAVLHNHAWVCGNDNPRAFKKLRALLMMGFIVQGKTVDVLGPLETEQLVRIIRQHLCRRLGGRVDDAG